MGQYKIHNGRIYFDDGGNVPEALLPNEAMPQAAQVPPALAPNPQPIIPQVVNPVQMQRAQPSMPGGQAESVSSSPLDPMTAYNSSFANNLEGRANSIRDYMNKLGASQKGVAGAYQNLADQLEQEATPEEIQEDYSTKDAAFQAKLKDQQDKFDPNRYFHSMSTPQKIGTAIALALGGAGGGMNRTGVNPAYEMVKAGIQNDIDHQKADMSNTMNLWKMNHTKMQDELSANLATKNQLYSVAQQQIAQQAANATTAEKQMNLQQLLFQIQNEKDMNNRAQSLLSRRSAGPNGTLPQEPEMVISQLIQDPEQRKAALGEVEAAKTIEAGRQIANNSFDDLQGKMLGGKFSPEDRKSAIAATALDVAKRFNIKPAAAQEMIEPLMPGGGWTGLESEDTVSNKRQRLNALFDAQKPSMGVLKSMTGLGPEDFSATSSNPLTKLNPQELKMYNIAKAHPNEPASIKFFQKYRINR